MLAIGGWADAYVNAPPALAANLSAPAKALIGPWEHKYPHIARIDPAAFHGEVIRWFDRWLKGERNGAEELPAYRVFIQEHREPPSPLYGPRAGRWVGEAAWPSPNVGSTDPASGDFLRHAVPSTCSVVGRRISSPVASGCWRDAGRAAHDLEAEMLGDAKAEIRAPERCRLSRARASG